MTEISFIIMVNDENLSNLVFKEIKRMPDHQTKIRQPTLFYSHSIFIHQIRINLSN